MPHIRVASDDDECRVWWDGAAWHYDFAHHETIPGYVIATIYKAGYGMIFRNVPVTQGKPIQLARVTFTAFGTSDNDFVNTYIHGELDPNPLPFSSYEDYAARVRTDARVTWDAISHWHDRDIVKTPDIKAIIQEIIDLPEWEEGDDICLFWHDHDDRSTHVDYTTRMAETHHHNPNLAPQLTIHCLEDNLMESYTIGGDTWFNLGGSNNIAQTLEPQASFALLYLDVDAVFTKPWAFPRAHIRKGSDALGPYGATLSASKLKAYVPTYNTGKYRIRLEMERLTLEEGVCYAIELFSPYGPWPDSAMILFHQGDAAYPRGNKLHSSDGGVTWTPDWNDDVIFAFFGSPPIPMPPPEPPVRNWTILDIQQTLTANGFKIAVITNTPCHLFLMWTPNEPNKHKIVGLRRGDLALRETRHCFTGWHKNEQEEAGDTLTHTFYKEPWPVCETRWFTFKGEVETLWTASAGPIFKKHRPEPPITSYFYSDAHPEEKSVDGNVQHGYWAGLPWPELVAAPGNGASDEGDNLFTLIYTSRTRDKFYMINRNALLFDTSIIAPGRTILDAKLRIFVSSQENADDWPDYQLALVSSNPASNIALEPADYQRIGSQLLSPDLAKITDYPFPDGLFTFNLNAAGLASITKGGITKLGLREHYFDILGNIPDWLYYQRFGLHVCSADHIVPGKRPRLEVTYK